jgi:hypothetical protein
LHDRTVRGQQVWHPCAENWTQLQGLYVSTFIQPMLSLLCMYCQIRIRQKSITLPHLAYSQRNAELYPVNDNFIILSDVIQKLGLCFVVATGCKLIIKKQVVHMWNELSWLRTGYFVDTVTELCVPYSEFLDQLNNCQLSREDYCVLD